MKKIMIRSLCVVCALVLFPIVLYIGIVLPNAGIANGIERKLKATPLPENAALVDSISAARKLKGNGNGMQYVGSILVTGDLTEQELTEYYSQYFDDVEVRKQESAVIEFVLERYTFEGFDPAENNFSVTCWEYNGTNNFFSGLLDLDLRGH